MALDRQPHLAHYVECEVVGHHRAGQHRGVGDIEAQPGLSHRPASGSALGHALFVQGHVVPAGEQIELVPRAFAVSEDDEGSGHAAHGRWG